jgi:hypothetical protein
MKNSLLLVFFLMSVLTQSVYAEQKTAVPTTEKKPPLDLILPSQEKSPGAPSATAGANSNASSVMPVAPEGGLGLAGNIYHRATLTGSLAVGGTAMWHPFSSIFFVRGGVNYNYYPNNGQFSYSWGIGVDDFIPGMPSIQLNNWGPTSKGLGLSQASVNVGYKFEADFLKPYNLSGSASVNIPIKGDPNVSTTWQWEPIEHWFVRASVMRRFGSQGGWDWTYNFGYANYSPFSFSLTYDNWGQNRIFSGSQQDAFNFKEKGAVTLSWSWAF